jgi:UDP-glucose 4-epimerase
MNVLVTGGSGFFGSGIVRELREHGHRVVVASREAGASPDSVRLNITSPTSCKRVFEVAGPIDTVVHAAALAHVNPRFVSSDHCHLVNAGGTEHMLSASASAGVSRFVFISSIMVYGDYDIPDRVDEDTQCAAEGAYGRAKVAAEEACRRFEGRMDVHVLRLAAMYDDNWLVNIRKRVRPLSKGPRVYFTLDPDSRRYSLCSRRNGSQAVRWAVESRLPPGIYNVADDYEYTQREILEAIERREGTGMRLPVPRLVPYALWHAVRFLVPVQRWRNNAHSRYWKFCRHNVYRTERLRANGFAAPAYLIADADGHPDEGSQPAGKL